MKARYNGTDCMLLKNGAVCDIEMLGPSKVKAKGKNFEYTFTYYDKGAVEQNWSILNESAV